MKAILVALFALLCTAAAQDIGGGGADVVDTATPTAPAEIIATTRGESFLYKLFGLTFRSSVRLLGIILSTFQD